MKSRTVVVHEGENLGPVDWSYDFRSHFNNICTSDAGRDEACEKAKDRLRLIEANPDRYEVTTYGGWPRCGWGKVVAVCMYDGWPFWKPTPSVCHSGTLGCEWHAFSFITNLRDVENGQII